MKNNINVKQINRSVFIASSLLVLSVAFTSPAHAAVVVSTPFGGVYVSGAPGYHGYGYRHGYYGRYGYGRGAAYRHGYGHGTVYHNGNAYHHGYHGSTAIHNGHVYHRR